MGQGGIVYQIIIKTIGQFSDRDPSHAAVVALLVEGAEKGKLQDSEWIAQILRNTEQA